MDWSGCEIVEIVPGKVSGVPVVRGSRVPASDVAGSLDAGESVEQVAYNYDLPLADVLSIKRYIDSHQPAYGR